MPDSAACGSIPIAFKVKFVFILIRRIFYSRTSFNLVFQSADRNEPVTNAEDWCLFHAYENKARSSKRVVGSKHVQRLPRYACDAQKTRLVL